jgi:putative methyltransferase (TIGR04325 family)
MNIRAGIKAWTPPALLDARRRLLGRGLRFSDAPDGWASAQRMCEGYSADVIVERVATATREVLAGHALFERDSVLFHQSDYRYPIIAALLRAASLNAGRLEVVDYGGSLGSTYRQCRPLLSGLHQIRWRVVEQANFAAVGQNEFSTSELSFSSTVAGLPPTDSRPLILLSSVLQYLEHPLQALERLLQLNPSHVVIDRSPMSAIDDHRLTIQHVPKSVYDASYPCWIISRRRLLETLTSAGFQVIGEFPGMEGSFVTPHGLTFEFHGLIAEK